MEHLFGRSDYPCFVALPGKKNSFQTFPWNRDDGSAPRPELESIALTGEFKATEVSLLPAGDTPDPPSRWIHHAMRAFIST